MSSKKIGKLYGRALSGLMCLLIAIGFLSGCKIEWPEDVREYQVSSGEWAGALQPLDDPDSGSGALESSWEEEPQQGEQTGQSEPQSTSSAQPDVSTPSGDSSGASSQAPVTSERDRYQTDPVPQSKPAPVEPEEQPVNPQKQNTVTLSIVCKTILDNMDQFKMDKIDQLPRDGVILSARSVVFYEGESVFDVLLRETKKNGIHMEFRTTPIYNSNYIMGIHNLYEFDCGETSGWMYRVNGWFPNYGCSRYSLKDGDVVEWVYTCDLGKDVGCDWLEDGLQGGTGS